MQRDRRSYDRPQVFDPDRWLPEHTAEVPRFAIILFGAGNRKCPGDHFAMVDAALMLATVASHWRLALVGSHRPDLPTWHHAATATPAHAGRALLHAGGRP